MAADFGQARYETFKSAARSYETFICVAEHGAASSSPLPSLLRIGTREARIARDDAAGVSYDAAAAMASANHRAADQCATRITPAAQQFGFSALLSGFVTSGTHVCTSSGGCSFAAGATPASMPRST